MACCGFRRLSFFYVCLIRLKILIPTNGKNIYYCREGGANARQSKRSDQCQAHRGIGLTDAKKVAEQKNFFSPSSVKTVNCGLQN